MHFDVLVEDASGVVMLSHLLPKVLDEEKHTFSVRGYRGIGNLPKNITSPSNLKHQALLNDLPRVLSGLGATHQGYGEHYRACVFVVCDLDDRCLSGFRKELLSILDGCSHKPETIFCVAVEEGEAWLLGDAEAIKAAYPNAKLAKLSSYEQDSICGTWEVLKSIVAPSEKFANKREWAERITPYIEVARNVSPSFQYFINQIGLADTELENGAPGGI